MKKKRDKKPEAAITETNKFVGHYLHTPYGVMIGVDEDGDEVRTTHQPEFLRVDFRIQGGRFVVSRRQSKGEDGKLFAVSLSSIRRIELTPALWKNNAFFPALICVVCLLVLGLRSVQGAIAELLEGFWEIDPFLIQLACGLVVVLFYCLPWIWQVWHTLWRRIIYSKLVVCARKGNLILYVSSWKDAEIAELLFQTGLPVNGGDDDNRLS